MFSAQAQEPPRRHLFGILSSAGPPLLQRSPYGYLPEADRARVIPLILNYRPVVTLQQVQGAGSTGSTFRSFQSFGSTYFGSMRQAGFEQYIGAKAA